MILLRNGGERFTESSASFLEQLEEEGSAKIYVRVRSGRTSPFYAMLDTGAAWSIFHPELAAKLGLDEADGIEAPRMLTLAGAQRGRLVKCPLTICADNGPDLELAATVYYSESWQGPNIIGYQGLLQAMRFAIDPAQNAGRWFFAALG